MKNHPTPETRPLRFNLGSFRSRIALAALAALLLLAGCGSSSDGDVAAVPASSEEAAPATASGEEEAEEEAEEAAEVVEADEEPALAATEGLNVGLFFDGALAEDVTTEDCTLSGGAEATCYSITVAGFPASHDVGPFCPETITDGADAGGIWFDGVGVYDLDGEFIENLPELYDDENWHMHDDDGNVHITETAEEFDGAARPDVDVELQNHCVEGRLEWLDNGEAVTSTVLIPTVPVAADSAATSRGNLGVTLDGVVIAASAPVDAILSAYTIAAFDDCGAHFNPFEGYHMHGATGCSEVGDAVDDDPPMFGYAMDGYPVHSPFADGAAPDDLDECNGHTTDAAGYHYHANSAAMNQVIECFFGQVVATEEGGRGGPPE